MQRQLITLLTILLSFSLGYSQVQDSCRKKIGLVISGGGAKCMAAIGALKVIEESGLKIDYISGTSMGAIIGSMYSLGYSADDIEHYMRKVDWEALLNNSIPRKRLSYFDRKSESRYLLTFPFENGKIRLPSGLNYAQYILKQLSYLTQQSYRHESFREFPIPFLCVATNLENGEMEVFEDGSLGDALRASSAFPSLFTPYELNGKLYVDGGVVNNYPVQPLKERGVDYIIGVDVQDFLYKKEQLNSVARILEQTSSFVNAHEYLEQLSYTDLLIKPDISEASITSFELFDILVARGEEAARLQLPQLLELAGENPILPKDTLEYSPLPLEEFYIKSIDIQGLNNHTKSFVFGKLRIDSNEVCSTEKLEAGLDQLYGSKYFNSISYTLAPLDTGYRLRLNVDEDKSLAEFRLGLHYDTDLRTALLLNFTRRNFLFNNSRFSAEIGLGDNPRANISYFIDRGLVPSVGIKFRANRFDTRIYENLEPISSIRYTDFSLDLFVQSTIYDLFAIGGGIQLEAVDLSKDIAITSGSDVYSTYINYYGFLDFDSFDNTNYPTKGTRGSIMARIISEHDDFESFFIPSSVIDFSFGKAIAFTDRISLVTSATGLFTLGPELNYPYNIFLGSMGQNYINYITPFIGYRFMELAGRNALILRTDANLELWKKHYLIIKANWGKLENSFEQTFNSDVILDGYSIGYSYDSPIGPLEISATGSTNHPDIYTYISLGFWF